MAVYHRRHKVDYGWGGRLNTNLYLRSARLSDHTAHGEAGIRGPAAKANRDKRRVEVSEKTVDGVKYVAAIEVELDSAAWSVDRAVVDRKLVITLTAFDAEAKTDTGITVPIPASLDVKSQGAFRNYTFPTSSAAATGGFLRLKSYGDRADRKVEGQPSVKVGNIASGEAVKVTVDRAKSYIGDENDFTITFEALGPIYNFDNPAENGDDIDAGIDVDLSVDTALQILPKLPAKTDPPITVTQLAALQDSEGERT